MKVSDLYDEKGRVFAFEVGSFWIGRSGIVSVVRRIPGVKIIRAPNVFGFSREEEFCEFEVEGQRFEIWEPFGDSDRYWIGPKPPQWCEQLDLVRTAFLNCSQKQGVWQTLIRFIG